LATINQAFSLLDPQFFRLIIDRYARTGNVFSKVFALGGSAFPCGGVGAAFVFARCEKFSGLLYKHHFASRRGWMYTDTIAHAFSLPYGIFERRAFRRASQKVRQARDTRRR